MTDPGVESMQRQLTLFSAAMVLLGSLLLSRVGAAAAPIPQFEVDPFWPKPLPNHWQLGPVTGVFGDEHGLVWIANQSNRLRNYDLALARGEGDCCNRAPQIIAFDSAGTVVKSWNVSNGPEGCQGFKCLAAVHTIYVDHKGNVWISGNGAGDSQLLKFTSDGKFLLQIGGSSARGCCGNQDIHNLGGGTGIAVWPATNEVFVSDGYFNRRVIVFDADTGKFKRMWGAYGRQPENSVLTAVKPDAYVPSGWAMLTPEPERRLEGAGAPQWSTVHGVSITPDGVVWVADRRGSRIQLFHVDGTYIREGFVARQSIARTTDDLAGTVYGFAFSRDPDFKYVYVADGNNKKIHILRRDTLEEVSHVSGRGGQAAGAFNHVHVAAVDTEGNLYTGEAAAGARVQRWRLINK